MYQYFGEVLITQNAPGIKEKCGAFHGTKNRYTQCIEVHKREQRTGTAKHEPLD